MSSVAQDACNSCFMVYNSTGHAPLILSCYHTYCRSCVDTFMFQNQQITCLSCSQVTQAVSVSSLPQNPYLQPRDSISPLPPYLQPSGGPVEDVFYSDSDEEKPSSVNSVSEELKRKLIIDSQRKNIILVSKILDNNVQNIQTSKNARKIRNKTLNETLSAVEKLKMNLENEIKANKEHAKIIYGLEKKSFTLSQQFAEVHDMDYSTIELIYQEAAKIQKMLKEEVDFSEVHKLERAISQSTVKINFDKADQFLGKLKAESEEMFLKLATSLDNDSELIFLQFMLTSLFTHKISTDNKDFLSRTEIEYNKSSDGQFEDLSKFIVAKEAKLNPIKSKTNLKSTVSAEAASEWNLVSSKINNSVAGLATKSSSTNPISFSDMAKKQANPAAKVIKRIPFPEKTIAQTNRPHCFFKVQVDNDTPFRVVFELRPDMAPKMVENFVKLCCKGLSNGRGYKGSNIYRAKIDDHILGGDFENNDGTGGHSAFEERYVLAEQCPLRDHKGAIRMRGQERTMDGRCKYGSQFMIWVGDLEYKEYRFTLVFGKVVEGFNQLLEVSRIKGVQKSPSSWILKQTVKIVDCGTLK